MLVPILSLVVAPVTFSVLMVLDVMVVVVVVVVAVVVAVVVVVVPVVVLGDLLFASVL